MSGEEAGHEGARSRSQAEAAGRGRLEPGCGLTSQVLTGVGPDAHSSGLQSHLCPQLAGQGPQAT